MAGIDMVNHAVGENDSAYFDLDNGKAVLRTPPERGFRFGEEVTIRSVAICNLGDALPALING